MENSDDIREGGGNMRVVGNTITTLGVATLIFAGCCLESPEPYCYIMAVVALAGAGITYLGYRLEEIVDYLCWSRNLRMKQRRKHRKVKMWLDRAQKSF